MDLVGFRDRFPEFVTAEDAIVQAVLDAAAKETSQAELGASYDEAHGLLAAHKLAMSPFGQSARMLNDDGRTTYELVRADVIRRTVPAVTVAGGPAATE